ncbi:MAG TPA: amidohydrolase family protein [Acidimicrobiia bacterium]|nr:amidohydrolase family protein [Acidimicrobiia bacterium]
MTDRYLLISSDCHAGPESGHYREYMDPAFLDAYDEHLAEVAELRRQLAGNAPGPNSFRDRFLAETGDAGMQSVPDAQKRDVMLDADGVAAEVIFPDADVLGVGKVDSSPFGSGLGSSGSSDPEKVMAGARAHNRWLADLCAGSPERRLGIACVPVVHDPEASVAEIKWAAEHGLRGGIMIPHTWAPYPAYNHERYDPVWAACVEHDMTVQTHSGGGLGDLQGGPGAVAIIASEAWFMPARPLWVLLLGGVFERFPQLRFAVTEDGAWWVPDMIERADDKYLGTNHNVLKMGEHAFRDGLTMKPSEYFARNCWVGASTPTPSEIARRRRIGLTSMMWGNDFPHPEGTWPHTREWVAIRFHDVPEAECRRIFGLNALECYPAFDRAKLEAIAERIGPTVHDVHIAPVPDNPDVAGGYTAVAAETFV